MKYLKGKTWLTAVIIVVAIVILSLIFNVLRNGKFDTFEVKETNFTQTVSISGKVVPVQEIDLGFEASGEIRDVYVRIGDVVNEGQILASLDQSELSGEIGESASSLQSELARLSELTGTVSTLSQVASRKTELVSVLNKAQVGADDIVRNKIDTFFEDPEKRYPEFNISLGNYFLRQEINTKRATIGTLLEEWRIRNSALNGENVTSEDASYSINALRQIEDLLITISTGTTDFNTTGDITQAQIDAYIAGISSARSIISGYILEINKTVEIVRDIEAEIPIQQAKVENARATVSKFNSRASSYVIRAPFAGIITAREIDPGEVSDTTKTAISMIADSDFEIEIFIPEVRIAGVNVGNLANIKLDAFGEDTIFTAQVSHIDPRETEKDGITTYRALLELVENNEEIRLGMTADVEIIKQKIENVLMVPFHLVKEEGDKKYVEVLDGKILKKEVLLGEKDGKGSVIIEAGVNVGDTIVVPK